jgi:hypothetical protein
MGALGGESGQPAGSLRRALIFEAAIGVLAVLPVVALRKREGDQGRRAAERRVLERSAAERMDDGDVV